jgi:hypothetical protein
MKLHKSNNIYIYIYMSRLIIKQLNKVDNKQKLYISYSFNKTIEKGLSQINEIYYEKNHINAKKKLNDAIKTINLAKDELDCVVDNKDIFLL